jgi:ABC-type Fe3+/spermidine/putrescine transport system ATPase subunit
MAKQASARPGTRGGRVELVELCRVFDDQVAVDGIDLEIPPGELFSVLGPSGCVGRPQRCG